MRVSLGTPTEKLNLYIAELLDYQVIDTETGSDIFGAQTIPMLYGPTGKVVGAGEDPWSNVPDFCEFEAADQMFAKLGDRAEQFFEEFLRAGASAPEDYPTGKLWAIAFIRTVRK